jgi:hypothetical protein
MQHDMGSMAGMDHSMDHSRWIIRKWPRDDDASMLTPNR